MVFLQTPGNSVAKFEWDLALKGIYKGELARISIELFNVTLEKDL